jgi:hypothetical protein
MLFVYIAGTDLLLLNFNLLFICHTDEDDDEFMSISEEEMFPLIILCEREQGNLGER